MAPPVAVGARPSALGSGGNAAPECRSGANRQASELTALVRRSNGLARIALSSWGAATIVTADWLPSCTRQPEATCAPRDHGPPRQRRRAFAPPLRRRYDHAFDLVSPFGRFMHDGKPGERQGELTAMCGRRRTRPSVCSGCSLTCMTHGKSASADTFDAAKLRSGTWSKQPTACPRQHLPFVSLIEPGSITY